jgi:hypothetical protein
VSTFLVSLGVVAATIAAVLYVALSGPEQPAMTSRPAPRARRRRGRSPSKGGDRAGRASAPRPDGGAAGTGAPAPVGLSPGPALALPDSDPMRLRVLPAAPTTVWVRIRSGVALVVLVAVLGALLALAVGGVLVGAALLIRSATA